MFVISQKANIVIVGGGIFGCAIAYYYTRNYPGKKVLVLERNEICNAATSRAAALMTIVRSKKSYIPLSLETYQAVVQMEKQLGESLDMRMSGMMHLAASDARVEDLNVLLEIADQFRQPYEYLSSERAHSMSPWLKADEAMRIVFFPGEAYCDPYLLGTFFSRCARQQGAEILQSCAVKELIYRAGAVYGVKTSQGTIEADIVIDAAGAWANVLSMQTGTAIPMAPVRSQYWITEKADIFPVDGPMVLLPDAQAYARPEGGALLFGVREHQSLYASPDKLPDDISNFMFSDDKGMSDLAENGDRLARFFPHFYDTGIKYYMAGFSGYTPDGQLVMGKVPGVENFLLASGCCGAGIAVSGGVGLALAELASGNPSTFDLSDFDVSRFGKIDPFSTSWLERCAMSRSKKLSG
ncbi:FAD-binding oxidoreductase [Terrimonas sp.]|uniref:NAD(P)/FAD-dependent oxidoreductase n=1 Tax=Terrimonas sp. TaxID=1914338 RepID=UPI000D508521|nr:FAD-binding oxidoreductase [Terrimonas sp.]PVD52870.1 FAD-binding oxidoreductase [Terrimonas sp.]